MCKFLKYTKNCPQAKITTPIVQKSSKTVCVNDPRPPNCLKCLKTIQKLHKLPLNCRKLFKNCLKYLKSCPELSRNYPKLSRNFKIVQNSPTNFAKKTVLSSPSKTYKNSAKFQKSCVDPKSKFVLKIFEQLNIF